MAIIFEDSAKVTKKQIPIPQNAKNVFKAMKKIYDKVEIGTPVIVYSIEKNGVEEK